MLNYNPKTGVFTHRLSRGGMKRGNVAGWRTQYGYVDICVDYHLFKAHRLAFLYMTGLFPSEEIDHINGKPADNRWQNLREATRTLNQENRTKAYKNNASGLLGVSIRKERKSNPWQAVISVAGKTVYIGVYSTPEAAHEAYLHTKRQLHKGCVI